MSDEEEFLSEESYEFEFEDEDESEAVNEIASHLDTAENRYYHAKGLKDESIDDATESYKRLIESCDNDEEIVWIFKSCKQLAKIYYFQKNYPEALVYIRQLISLLPKINGNYAEDSINKLLTRYMQCINKEFVNEMYDIIVTQLQDSGVSGVSGHRLWLRISLNRFHSLLDSNDLISSGPLLESIKEKLKTVSELTRTSFALDVLAAEIEYTMKTGADLVKLNELFLASNLETLTITHPRVMGVIRECGATVQFYCNNFEVARIDFYECFKNYDEAGVAAKRKILKYLSLCSWLTESEVNPFESQETQSYALLKEYQNLIRLGKCLEAEDLGDFIEVLAYMETDSDPLVSDPIFKYAVKHIRKNLEIKVLLKYLRVYRTISFGHLVTKLFLDSRLKLEQLILEMANNGSLSNIKVDFTGGFINTNAELEKSSIFPPNLDENSLQTNLRVLYDLGYCRASNGNSESDTNFTVPHDGTYLQDSAKLFRGSSNSVHEYLLCTQKIGASDAREWYKFMISAIPASCIESGSKADRLNSSSQEVTTEDDIEKDEADLNTKSGLLGSLVGASGNTRESREEEIPRKLDLLRKWTHDLRENLQSA